MDVVRVLANTYYADCEHKQMPDADAMRSALERLTQTARQVFAQRQQRHRR